ncbi:hypothetical protein D3C81_1054180 [compost metagenome]
MHWLPQFQEYVVGNVHHRIYRTNAAATQLLTHPQRAGGLDVDAFHYAAKVTRTRLWRIYADRQRIVNGGSNRAHVRFGQGNLVQHPNVTRHANNAQAIGAVRRYADFDRVVIQLQIFTDIGANRCVFRQLNDTVVIVSNTQLGERAQHPFRRLTAQFGGFDFEIARQHRAHGSNGHFQTGTAVWCTTDDIQ